MCADIQRLPDCALSADGDVAGGCYLAGTQQYNCGLFEQAAASFRKSADLRPEARTLHALGDALLVQDKLAGARDAYRSAVELEPAKRMSWMRLGQVLRQSRDDTGAHQAYLRAEALDPAKVDALQADAEAQTEGARYDGAVATLVKAEKLGDAGTRKACIQQEAEILQLEVRRAVKARDDNALLDASTGLANTLERLAGLSPTDAEVWRELAQARMTAGDFAAAARALQKASDLDPRDFISPRLLGLLREKEGDASGAGQAMAASLKVQPKQALPHLVLARLAIAQGEPSRSRAEFGNALTLEDGKDPLEVTQLAELAERLGADDKAEGLYEMLVLDPDQASKLELWLTLARVSARLHHDAKVKTACDKARALVPNAICPPMADGPRK